MIYGSVHRCVDHLEAVLAAYPRNQIVLLDGEDSAYTASSFFGRFPLFKRELVEKREGLFPISFSIPKQKIAALRPAKDKRFGTCIPGNKKTYVFKTERDYYAEGPSS